MNILALFVVLVLGVCGVLSRPGPEDHANIKLLPANGTCGVQVGTFPPAASDGSGSPTGYTEFPWLALLGYSKKTSSGELRHSCSGMLINDRYVITGAHCASGLAKKNIGDLTRVRLGEYNLKPCTKDDKECAPAGAVKDIEVEDVIVHPDYLETDKNHHNDIALIRLKEAAPYTDYIRPICLPLGDEETTSGNLILSGWDRDNKDENKNLKQKSSLPFVATSECQIKYKNHQVSINDNQLCAGGITGVHSCIALGGSPLMALNPANQACYAEGIVSFGPRFCATDGVPDVFTKIKSFVPWVLDTIKP